MPYLRLYSLDVPLAQKRLLAQKLIEITLRAFRLPAEDRHRINVQFISLPIRHTAASRHPVIPRDANCFLEVNDLGLTEENKRSFADEVMPMLTKELAEKTTSRFVRLIRFRADTSRQVALQFTELNPDEQTSRDSSFVLKHRAA